MSNESKSAGNGGMMGNGWVAAVLLAAGALTLREVPLQGTRPAANEPRIEQRFAVQDIDARLWQDPFGAVVRAREERGRKPLTPQQREEERELHAAAALAQEIGCKLHRLSSPCKPPAPAAADHSHKLVVLAVMVSGGPYAEYVESRRRTRYAVLAGLNAADYAPVDTEHLGYFLPDGNLRPPFALPEAVPYEWFDPAPGRNDREKGASHPVLVLWLDSGAFYERPLAHLRRLMGQLDVPTAAGARSPLLWRVLGPIASDGLRAMVDEVERDDYSPALFKERDLRFYSLAATVSDSKLLESIEGHQGQSLSHFFGDKGFSFLRTIGDDKQLAESLTRELQRRGLKTGATVKPTGGPDERADAYRAMCKVKAQDANSPHQIAIVAEWDTLYGRSLRREFRIREDDDEGFCVSRFHYVRGLDGQLPDRGSAAPSQPEGASAKEAGAAKDSDRRNDGSFIERAEGQSQFDYLRRLAARLRERDAELRASGVHGSGLRAIGVLGNDVHDKLLVLQALRADFPNALFFTTDLDARFLHPREQAWARNLIVASNFGLRLDDGLQAGTPPFRDNYQTSAFFSTRLALEDLGSTPKFTPEKLVGWLDQPRLFEIGRSQAFDFSAPAGSRTQDGAWSCRSGKLLQCVDIHPPGTPRYPYVPPLALALCISAFMLLLWLPPLTLNRGLQRSLRRYASQRRGAVPPWLRQLSLLAALALLQIGLPLLLARAWPAFADWLTRDGKPISLSEGLSLWPTEAIHLLTLLLCLYLVFRGWTALTRNLDRLSLELHLGTTRRRLVAEQQRLDVDLSVWQRLSRIFRLRPTEAELRPAAPPALEGDRLTEGKLARWRHFIVQNRTGARFLRSFACAALALALGVALHQSLAEVSGVPQRGEISRTVHTWLAIAAILLMNFLVFYVADATLICLRFISDLRPGRANWPQRAIHFFGERMAVQKDELLDYWINLQFIAKRTRCVSGLIYYPFIVLSLLLLSRSQVFDNWQMPVAAIAMAALDVGVVLISAIALRRAAEKARHQALQAIDDWLLQAHAPDAPKQPAPRQLELMRRQIAELDEGAFAPFSQQPLVKAVLLPFATLGGTSLLDFLSMANV
ncbi:hypothetical protein [Roseateles violae]|uniref:Uncharacterized protein n=1 Tax=Roseateles violae TaxID=3058042 RepID=A0ABT8DPY2_9BURK|nr:hypothetical protein [Pelomonas sp. PFR6]MDN3920411.1 hypothetical protein [Pelomonas sp. PFR6]